MNADDHKSNFGDSPDNGNGRRKQTPRAIGGEGGKVPRTRMREHSSDKPADKPFPIIRKPVSVKQSGALRAPKPGDPVEPPPPLTDIRHAREFRKPATEFLNPENAESEQHFDGLDQALNDDDWPIKDEEDWPLSNEWVDKNRQNAPVYYDDPSSGAARKWGVAAASVLIISGTVMALHDKEPMKGWIDTTYAKLNGLVDQQDFSFGKLSDFLGEGDQEPTVAVQEIDTPVQTTSAPAPRERLSLNDRFREELALLETLVEQGKLTEASVRLETMDRAVFGYGSMEFTEISERIADLNDRADGNAEPTQQIPSTEQTAEAERLAQLQAEQDRAAAEAERQAQLQAEQERAAAEAERLAQLQAEQERAAAEAERLAQLQAEQDRAAAEAERLAQLQAEQDRAAAEAERLAQLEAEQERAAAEAEREAQLQAEQERAAAEAERVAQLQAEQERAAAEAERVARQQEEQARAAALAEQLAERERADAAEAERLARQQEEQVRAAALARQLAERQAEQERAAVEAEQAAQFRADRLAQERARQDQLDQATAAREAASQGNETSALEQGGAQAGEQSTLTIQEIAARQREEARQQRLRDAQIREQQAEQDPVDVEVAVTTESSTQIAPDTDVSVSMIAGTETVDEPASRRDGQRPITETDLQEAYRQFVSLKNAIEDRELGSVLDLTSRSGLRVQQMMQMFENNVSISARLRNVSTLEAAGEIRGVLQITRLERADGMVTGPPPGLESVPLVMVRQDDGWSSIRW